MYKLRGDTLFEKFTDLFKVCWEREVVPQDLRDAVMVSLYKTEERNQTVPILLSITGKTLARVILDRLIITNYSHNC